jgi:hypothetical protein
MHGPGAILFTTVVGVLAAASPSLAQTKPAQAPEAASGPSSSSLVVGALQIGSAAKLAIAGIDIGVAGGSVTYSYYLQNTGTADIAVAAAISLPELQASGDETWALASNDAENFVALTITAGGAPVATKAELHAYALGVDRLAEIKAEHLPLIPFGPALDKALAGLAPDAADRLAGLGIISLRDAANPKTPLTADWSFDVARSWRQVLAAGKTTPIIVKFTPVAGQYTMVKGDEADLEDMKDDLCLEPQALGSLQSRLKGGGAWKVTDLSLSAVAPAHWIDSPNPTLSVQKPAANAIVAFCGMDSKTASRPAVLGSVPEDSDQVRVVIFEPAAT